MTPEPRVTPFRVMGAELRFGGDRIKVMGGTVKGNVGRVKAMGRSHRGRIKAAGDTVTGAEFKVMGTR